MTRTHTQYFAVFVLIHSNVHGKNTGKSGQALVASEKALWQLIGARYYDPIVAKWCSTDPITSF
jgi:hypothetical protein